MKKVKMLKNAERTVDQEVMASGDKKGSKKVKRHYVASHEYELDNEIADSLVKKKEAEEVKSGGLQSLQDGGKQSPSKDSDSGTRSSK